MGLLMCGDCGAGVSTSAETCPKCGAKITQEMKDKYEKRMAQQRKILQICGLVLALSFLIIVIVARFF
jgi:uncharacterized membrane protein YvbJ